MGRFGTTRRLAQQSAVAIVGSAVMALSSLGVASAAQGPGILDQGTWEDQGTDVGVCEQYTIDWHAWGWFQIDNATAKDDYQFFVSRGGWSFESVVTNPANGKWFIERGRAEGSDKPARPLGDGVFGYKSLEHGVYEQETSGGTVVYRDRWLVLVSMVWDTEGDLVPGGHFVEEPRVLADSRNNDDFCAAAARLIG